MRRNKSFEERRMAIRRRVDANLAIGRLSVPFPQKLREEIADVIESRAGLEVGAATVIDLEQIVGDQVIEFLSSERILRYIDRDVASGKYAELFEGRLP